MVIKGFLKEFFKKTKILIEVEFINYNQSKTKNFVTTFQNGLSSSTVFAESLSGFDSETFPTKKANGRVSVDQQNNKKPYTLSDKSEFRPTFLLMRDEKTDHEVRHLFDCLKHFQQVHLIKFENNTTFSKQIYLKNLFYH